MSIAKELNTPIPARSLINILVLAAFALFAIYIHNGAQDIRTNIRSEQSCLEQAKTRADVDACFALMKLNNSKE